MEQTAKPSQELIKQDISRQFNFFDPEQFAVMQRVCQMFASSELVPELYKISDKNPKEKAIANCMIAIEISQRIGASPLMVMQNMNIIYGRPSWASKFLVATVNACGKYNSIKYKRKLLGSAKGTVYTEYKWDNAAKKKLPVVNTFQEDVENWECIAYTSEKGSNDILESIPVSIVMAIQEGWYTKDGSKWRTMPKLMLQYRAASFWTNAYAPELSMGIKTSEEAQDFEDIPHEDVTDKVEQVINDNANKEEMKLDDENPDTNSNPGESNPI